MKRFFLFGRMSLLLLTFITLSLSGCKKTGGPVVIMLDWTPNTNHTGLYVAKDKGYYKSEGLDVKIVQPSEESTTMLVAAGKVPFGISFQDTLSNAFCLKEPLPVTAVAAIIEHNTNGIISLKEKDIKCARDLEGKTFSTWQTPIETATLKCLVQSSGGDFEKVHILPTSVYNCVEGLGTKVDAMSVYWAWDGVAAKLAGLDINFLPYREVDERQDCYTPVIIANNEYLLTHKEEAKKFLLATKKGYIDAIEDPDGAAEILLKYNSELDKRLVKESQKWLSANYCKVSAHWGEFDSARWARYYEWVNDEAGLGGVIDTKSGFTNEYLR